MVCVLDLTFVGGGSGRGDLSHAIPKSDLVSIAFGGARQRQGIAVFDETAGLACFQRQRFFAASTQR